MFSNNFFETTYVYKNRWQIGAKRFCSPPTPLKKKRGQKIKKNAPQGPKIWNKARRAQKIGFWGYLGCILRGFEAFRDIISEFYSAARSDSWKMKKKRLAAKKDFWWKAFSEIFFLLHDQKWKLKKILKIIFSEYFFKKVVFLLRY